MFIETFHRIFVIFNIKISQLQSGGHLGTSTVTVKVSPDCQGNGWYPN